MNMPAVKCRISKNMGGVLNLLFLALLLCLFFFSFAAASETSGTIDSTNKYAWSNYGGWVNFNATNGGISITDSGITGYAWNENYGWINMSPTNSGIEISSNGNLSGYAWGQNTGWIDFSSTTINCSGKFTGTADGNTIGTINFDCTNCNVSTDYRPQNCRDTGGSNATHNVCDNSTHKCVLAKGQGTNECWTIGEWCCDPHGDLDFDKSINWRDFSILMTYWSNNPPTYKCPDINKGGKVWWEDFSIMMTYWSNKF